MYAGIQRMSVLRRELKSCDLDWYTMGTHGRFTHDGACNPPYRCKTKKAYFALEKWLLVKAGR